MPLGTLQRKQLGVKCKELFSVDKILNHFYWNAVLPPASVFNYVTGHVFP